MAVWLIWHPSRAEAAAVLGVTMSAYSGAVHNGLERLTEALGPHRQEVFEALAGLGSGQAFAVVAEVFQGDLPEQN